MPVEEEYDFNVRCTNPILLPNKLLVPCCKCLECRVRRTGEWTVRLMHELHGKRGSFITLTYNDDHLPANGSLVKEHLQLFVKRLRKYLDEPIKYFAVGEYGETTQRPHYHLIVIGWTPDFKDSYKPGKYWASKEIERLWKYGNNTFGSVSTDSIQYTCGYVRKKLYGKAKENLYAPRVPPFQLQSQGMGLEYAREHEQVIFSDRGITMNGKYLGIPRYYKKKLVDKGSDRELQLKSKAVERFKREMRPYFPGRESLAGLTARAECILPRMTLQKANYIAAREADERRRYLDGKAREGLFKKGTF